MPINLSASDLACRFEEVYLDGTIQQGYVLKKNEKLRYQYNQKKLITIIAEKSGIFYLQNRNYENFYKFNNDSLLIGEILTLLNKPFLEDTIYKKDDFTIHAQLSDNKLFYKKIGISSEQLNLSIYFMDCDTKPINDYYFYLSPFREYSK